MVDLLPENNEPLLREREDTFSADSGVPKERFYRTSAVSGVGIDELFKAVSDYCATNVKDLKLYNMNGRPDGAEENSGNKKKCCVIQ